MHGLVVNGVTFSRTDDPLFTDLSFSVASGDVLQIAGRNGAGKTTLLRILSGLMLADEGNITWDNENIHFDRIAYQSDLAYLGHHNGLKEDSTVLENLTLASALNASGVTLSIKTALQKVHLSGFEDRLCRSLSAGQKRRVALARVLISPARLWILDEPFTAIDQIGITELEQLTHEHAQNNGMVILTSHHALSIPNLRVINLSELNP